MTIEVVGAILMHLAIFANWPYFAQSCTAKYFYGKMSSVAPTNSRTCCSEIETEKKRNETNTRRDLNPWSLDHKSCALELRQNFCSRKCTWFCTLKKILDQILATLTALGKFCFITFNNIALTFLPGTEEYPLIKNMGSELNPIAQELSSQNCCREGKKDKCWTIKQNAAHRQRMLCALMFYLLHLIRFCLLASINYIH